MGSTFNHTEFPKDLTRPLLTSSMRNHVVHFPQVAENILTKENMKPKTQQLALQKTLDLTKSFNEMKANQLPGREIPKVSPIKYEMPTGGSATTLTPGLSRTHNRLVEIPLQPQPQQGGSTQTTTTTAQICALPAQSNPPSFNQSSDNVEEQQKKKIKVNMDVIKERLDERTIVIDGTELVVIGANNTSVLREFLLELNWNNTGPAITRKLLSRIFGHKILATHTLTGRPSPAFVNMNKPEKGKLNQLIVQDIIEFMTIMTDMSARDVKTSIASKCADECKKRRHRLSIIALAPPEENITIRQEPMFAVSAARSVIRFAGVTTSDSGERNVITQPEAEPSDLTERNVVMEPEFMEI